MNRQNISLAYLNQTVMMNDGDDDDYDDANDKGCQSIRTQVNGRSSRPTPELRSLLEIY